MSKNVQEENVLSFKTRRCDANARCVRFFPRGRIIDLINLDCSSRSLS